MSSAEQSMAFFMLICAVPLIGLIVYGFRDQNTPGARGLLLCLIGMTGWSVQLALVTWPTEVLPLYINTTIRHTFQYLVIFGWPLFAWEYVKRERVRVRRTYVVALLVIPVLTILLTATNPLHHLVLLEETPANPAGISEFVLGPWYLVHIGFAVALVILPVGMLLKELRVAHGAHRKQLLLLLTGWAIGFPGALQTHLFRTIEGIPMYVDLTPLSFLVTAGLWGLALFRHQLFTMIPVSRRTVVETIPDPVVAVDQNGLVVDLNPAAKSLFDTPADVAGRPLIELFSEYPEIIDYYKDGAKDAELEIETDGGYRQFSVTCERIRDGGTEAIIVLRDITPLKEREQKLRDRERDLMMLQQVFSRVFRHNIRNELTVAQGHMVTIDYHTDDEVIKESAATALASTDRLLGHAEKAREIERVIDEDPDQTITPLPDLVSTATETYRQTSTGLTITTDVDDISVQVIEGFQTAIENAIENAIEHNPTPVNVNIRSELNGDTVELLVVDDGDGIPTNEIAVLVEGEETALNHGSGVGLWLMKWHIQKSNGTLEITGRDAGTEVQMTLQRGS